LLERAKRLMAKDFLEILRDLAPDGVPQFEVVSGINRQDVA
jgi:type VI secretion system protein ImpA